MPPRRKRNQPGAAAAGPAAAAVPQASLPGLPPDVLEMVTDHLIGQDKLNKAEACARDIASLAQVSRSVPLPVRTRAGAGQPGAPTPLQLKRHTAKTLRV